MWHWPDADSLKKCKMQIVSCSVEIICRKIEKDIIKKIKNVI